VNDSCQEERTLEINRLRHETGSRHPDVPWRRAACATDTKAVWTASSLFGAAPEMHFCMAILHIIPDGTETFARIPVGSPVFNGPKYPALQQLIGGLFGADLVGVAWQVRQLRRNKPTAKQGVSFACTRSVNPRCLPLNRRKGKHGCRVSRGPGVIRKCPLAATATRSYHGRI